MASNATNKIYTTLKQKILDGIYFPGEALIESDLANEYEVSRNTIKKAILMLESEDLVVTEPNRSAKVRSYSLEEVLEFLEVRALLEAHIAKLTTPVISDEDIQQLGEILKKMKQEKESRNLMGYSSLNQVFHKIIYDACPNKTLTNMTLQLKSQMRKYNSKTILVPRRDEASFAEHINIYNALKKRDAEAAEKHMTTHITNVSKTFKDFYHILF